jgi:hypothetical protein
MMHLLLFLLKTTFMYSKTLIFALLFGATALAAQETTPETTPETISETRPAHKKQQTLFNNARVRGGFGGPIFSWSSSANNKTGYGAGGGGGVILDQFFIGAFGMGETLDAPQIGKPQLALGYGGLWMGYCIPSHKILHLYTSVKLAGGGVGTTNFRDDWEIEDDLHDITFVAIPEAGIELNIARWMRVSGSVGYRFVEGFEGYGTYGKKDLNAPVYNLSIRFGFFGK